MKLKRDLFSRANRMTHRFGRLTDDDPLDGTTFDPEFPQNLDERESKGLTVKRHGLHRADHTLSPIVKPDGSGRASFSGPKLDVADAVEMPIPANTKKRTTAKPT